MDPAKDMNTIRLQMIDIARLLEKRYPFMEFKIKCPWCGRRSLLLKEQGAHYWCMNCKCEGSLDELEFKIYNDMMQEPRGVKL